MSADPQLKKTMETILKAQFPGGIPTPRGTGGAAVLLPGTVHVDEDGGDTGNDDAGEPRPRSHAPLLPRRRARDAAYTEGHADDTAEDRAVEEVHQVTQAVAALGTEDPRTQQATEAEADDEPGRGEPGHEEDREESSTPAQYQTAPGGVVTRVAAFARWGSRDRGDMEGTLPLSGSFFTGEQLWRRGDALSAAAAEVALAPAELP